MNGLLVVESFTKYSDVLECIEVRVQVRLHYRLQMRLDVIFHQQPSKSIPPLHTHRHR
jgi:hypothetical protein